MTLTELSGLAQANDSVILRTEHSGVLRIQSMVAPGRLSVSLAIAYCNDVFASHPSLRVGIIEVFEGPASPNTVANGSSHYSFKEYLDLYESFAGGNWRSARCILTPKSGSYVIRLGTAIDKGLLYGFEAPEVFVDGIRAEAIHISPGVPSGRGVLDSLTVFVLADRMPSLGAAVVIAAHMREYFGPKVGIVNIQDRPLFSFHEEFPVYPLYTSSEAPVTKNEYYRQYIHCHFKEQFTCRDAL
jgi:hypothetical protein